MFNYSMFFYFKNIPADIREINGPQSSRVIRKINRDFGSKFVVVVVVLRRSSPEP